MDDNPGDAFRCDLARITLNGNVAETHECEVRLERLRAAPFQGVCDPLARPAEIVRVKIAFLVKDFGVSECYDRSRRPFDRGRFGRPA